MAVTLRELEDKYGGREKVLEAYLNGEIEDTDRDFIYTHYSAMQVAIASHQVLLRKMESIENTIKGVMDGHAHRGS